MPVAYSGQPPVYASGLAGASPGALIASIDSVVRQAGWQATSVPGGYLYRIVSPQGFVARCLVANLGKTYLGIPGVTVQFRSDDQTLKGVEHLLLTTPARDGIWEIYVNPCQIFIATQGFSSKSPEQGYPSALYNAVCGGIPYVPLLNTPCFDNPASPITVTDVWWSSGAYSHAGEPSFRVATYNSVLWDGCWNGALMSGIKDENRRLRLAVRGSSTADYGIFPSLPKVQWFDGQPLFFDPMLIWGDPQGIMRAQIWDAVLVSKDMPLENEISDENNAIWRNWTHYDGDMSRGGGFSYYGCLYLLKSPPIAGGPSNYVY